MTSQALVRRVVRRGAALVCAAVCAAARVAAQTPTPTVTVTAPGGDTLRTVTPTFIVSGSGLSSARPLRIRFQLDASGSFNGTLLLDSTAVTRDSSAVFAPSRALPEDARIFYRASIEDPGSGLTVTSSIGRTGVVPKWVTPVSPPVVVGQTVRTRTPRFVWRSPQVNEPPGPWDYLLTIKGPNLTFETPVSDTTFVPNFDLEANARYTWTVAARLPRVGQGSVAGLTLSFFVEDPNLAVAITDLYPPFPSPFPSISKDATCIWFDLKHPSQVALEIFDLRGLHVKRLAPTSGAADTVLAAGFYGRGRTQTNEGCDGRFQWDGTDDGGRSVPEGVYLVRFRADGITRTRKVLYRGRR